MHTEHLGLTPLESDMSAKHLAQFEAFVDAVTAHDGTSAFSEQTLVAVRQESVARTDGTHNRSASKARLFFISNDDSEILGAWVAVVPTPDAAGVLEGAVSPKHRGRGVASQAVSFVISALGKENLSQYTAWVHQVLTGEGDAIASAAEQLTSQYGFTPVRELHKMAVLLTDDSRTRIENATKNAALPEGIAIKTFEPATDALAWLTLNAAAFASHPEQGKLTHDDLAQRMESSWFDARGFFIAHAPNGLAGYHWTKVETAEEGEVYAVGISPAWQGKKLGKVLTLTGMNHLAQYRTENGAQLERIVLYVDDDNQAAMHLYRSLGFEDLSVDRMYTH